MTSGRILGLILVILVSVAAVATAGELRARIEGGLLDPMGQPALDGSYPVTVRLWNGRGIHDSILWVDTVVIKQLKGRFRFTLGPYPALTRRAFSGDQSLSFEFAAEPEIRKRTILETFNSAGVINCTGVQLTTGNVPATSAGTRVRLHQGKTSPSIGVLLSISPERIELLQSYAPAAVTRIPLDSITRFDVSSRHRHYGDYGFLAGLLVGGVAGNAMGAREEADLSMSKETKRAIDSIVGAMLGGLTGYLLGNSMSGDRWQEVPIDRIRERVRTNSEPLVRSR